MFDMSVKWPNGARVAVMLTFDFDAETLWTSRDPENAKRPGVLSQGRYGANVGVPKILDTLEEAGVPGTFFVPGWTAENHTGRVEMIVRSGHEIGHHSYSHRWAGDSLEREIEEMEAGLGALQRTVGVVPRGYRSPAGEVGENLLGLLNEHGFLYDSSLLDHINPLPAHHAGRLEGPDRTALALVARRCAFRAIFDQEPAADLHERAYPEGFSGRISRDLPLGRALRSDDAPAGRRASEPHCAAARDDRLHSKLPGRLFATGTQVAEAWSSANE
jgi:peptidoglycan-N-acetylglucosamine deacetylase